MADAQAMTQAIMQADIENEKAAVQAVAVATQETGTGLRRKAVSHGIKIRETITKTTVL